MILIPPCAKLSAWAKKINMCASSHTATKKKKPTCFIGKSPAKPSIRQQNGNGGFRVRTVIERQADVRRAFDAPDDRTAQRHQFLEAHAERTEAIWRTTHVQNQVARVQIEPKVGGSAVLLGQDASFAQALARDGVSVAGILQLLAQAADVTDEGSGTANILRSGSPLAKLHKTTYPIVQGAMTRVSDNADFAYAVASEGALPFLALSLMRGAEVENLLASTKKKCGDLSWGVGILGFAPTQLREEQVASILKHKPPFALIAGGRPDQAKQFEDQGIVTYLHVPSPAILSTFLEGGAKHFVFEGRECGGHVGPRSSFVLWEQMIDVLHNTLTGARNAAEYQERCAVGFVEETFFRGLLQGAVVRETRRPLTSILLVSVVYSAVHFLARVKIPHEDLRIRFI